MDKKIREKIWLRFNPLNPPCQGERAEDLTLP